MRVEDATRVTRPKRYVYGLAHRRLVLIRHRVLDRLKAQRIAVGQTLGPRRHVTMRRASRMTRSTAASLHITIVAVFWYVGWLDHTVAVDLEQVDDATDKVDTCAKVANARPLVGAAHDHFRELDLARLGVEVERGDAHVALELNESVAVRVATYVETVEIAVVNLCAVHVELLGVRRVEEDDVDVAVADVCAD